MKVRKEFEREVFSGWFDLRRVLQDRRRLISNPELALADEKDQLANSPFKFAVKSIALPTAVLSFLATVPSTLVELPPTPEEGEIARLEARADSTERASHETLATLDSATIREAEESEYDSIRAQYEARLESLASSMPDTAALQDSVDAVLAQLDSLRIHYRSQVNPLLNRLDSLQKNAVDSPSTHDSISAITSRIELLLVEYQRQRSLGVRAFDSLMDRYKRLIALTDSQNAELRRLTEHQTYKSADLLEETAGYQREVAAMRLADLKLERFLSQFRLPIAAGLVILNAFFFGWMLAGRYEVSVRQGARLHMYLSSAVLFLPAIAFGLLETFAGVVTRFPEAPVNVGLLPVWGLLVAWFLYATYRAAVKIGSTVPKQSGTKSRIDSIWITATLVGTSFLTTFVGAFLINLATYPLSRLIVALNS